MIQTKAQTDPVTAPHCPGCAQAQPFVFRQESVIRFTLKNLPSKSAHYRRVGDPLRHRETVGIFT